MDLIFSDCFRRNQVSSVRVAMCHSRGEFCLPLVDVTSCLEADQPTTSLHTTPDAWARAAIVNVTRCGQFSSDPTIAE